MRLELPEEFASRMKEMLGEEYDAFLESYQLPRSYGLRVNTGKITGEALREQAPFALRQIPWVKEGYFYGEGDIPARHPYYAAGLYYLQEPSAMTPASRLPVSPGDRVLDLCAAPGGKATELAARLQGRGFLLANDISASRAGGLLKNLELAGAANILVASEDPGRLAEAWPEGFDKILVDAPCSGEGMFRRDSRMAAYWEQAGPDSYAEVQARLLQAAWRMLRPGGKLLYSTCTFSLKENEEQILKLLKNHPDLSPEPVTPYFEGFEPGKLGLSEAVRIYPHKMPGEGHFLALLKKSGTFEAASEPVRKRKGTLPPEAEDFLKQVRRDFSGYEFLCHKEQIYALCPEMEIKKGIRFLRTGLLLGSVRRGRFEPSQALAMALKKEEFDSVLDLSSADPRTVKYLKGETISLLPEQEGGRARASGWQLICTDGFPLGFAKLAGQNLKNKYQPGWRWQ